MRGSGAMIRVGRLVNAPCLDAGGVTLSVLGRAAMAPGGLGRSIGPVSSRRDSLTMCRLMAAIESAHES